MILVSVSVLKSQNVHLNQASLGRRARLRFLSCKTLSDQKCSVGRRGAPRPHQVFTHSSEPTQRCPDSCGHSSLKLGWISFRQEKCFPVSALTVRPTSSGILPPCPSLKPLVPDGLPEFPFLLHHLVRRGQQHLPTCVHPAPRLSPRARVYFPPPKLLRLSLAQGHKASYDLPVPGPMSRGLLPTAHPTARTEPYCICWDLVSQADLHIVQDCLGCAVNKQSPNIYAS